jgi:hypothetical protein
MKKMMISRFKSAVLMMMMMMGLVNGPYVNGFFTNSLYAATIQVDDGVNKQIETAAWGVGGLPEHPDVEWRFADSTGIDYDTIGGATPTFRQYGSASLSTGLTIGNLGGLVESPLQPNMGGVNHNGSSNYEILNDGTAMRPGANDFGVFAWARWMTTGFGLYMLSKYDTNAKREWAMGTSLYTAGKFTAVLSSDGGTVNRKVFSTTTSYNDGMWHLCGFTWVSDSLRVYVDGISVPVAIDVNTGITSIYEGDATPGVGCIFASGLASNFFPGDIAWSGYWEGTSTPDDAENAALYTAMKPTGTSASPYPSLQSAVDQASAGDTILVQPGRYQETVTISKALDYVGGWQVGTLYPTEWQVGTPYPTARYLPEFYGAALPAAAGTVGMTVSADNEIGFLTLRGYTTAQGLLASSTSDGSLFHHLEIDSCLNGVDFDGAASGDSLVNSVIDGGSISLATGFRATTSSAVTVAVINNIFVNTATALTKAAAQTLTETNNDFFGNGVNYAGTLHASDLLLPPLFRGGNDYRFKNMSRVLNAGTPIHNGTAPFNYLQSAPQMGVWEQFRVSDGNLTGGWGENETGGWE